MPNFEILQYSYLGNDLRSYLYAIAVLVGFAILGKVVKVLVTSRIEKIAKRTKTKLDDLVVDAWKEISSFLFFVAGLYFAMGFLSFDQSLKQIVDISILVVVTFKVTRVAQFFFNSFLKFYLKPLSVNSKIFDDQFLIFFRKLGNVIIWVLAILFVLANMNVNITSLVTGLGIGGLALALGAQETISNVFAALALLGDRPFQIGDWTIIDGQEGTIKELGLRSVKLITFDGTEIVIPTKKAASAVIENVDRRNSVKVNASISLDNDSRHEQITNALENIKSYLKDYKKEIEHYRVHFYDYKKRGLNLLIQYWVKEANDWEKFLEVQTNVNLKMKEIFEKEGLKLAKNFES